MTRPTRRRFLAISAAACALGSAARAGAATETVWRGRALGAEASMRLAGLPRAEAAPILAAVEGELHRLEGIFSLYRDGSALRRLNASGRLADPPPELLEVLSLCDVLHRATEGAFDPTVQPLFALAARAAQTGAPPSAAARARARGAVGWDDVGFGAGQIRLFRPGAALTLNGIAQGFITDRIAAILRTRGLSDILVDMGEVVARGHGADGAPWTAGIADPSGAVVKRLTLADRAIATSAPRGTVLNGYGHIFDPETGTDARGAALVTVSAPRAALADGLSTALCVMDRTTHTGTVAAFPGARLEFSI